MNIITNYNKPIKSIRTMTKEKKVNSTYTLSKKNKELLILASKNTDRSASNYLDTILTIHFKFTKDTNTK